MGAAHRLVPVRTTHHTCGGLHSSETAVPQPGATVVFQTCPGLLRTLRSCLGEAYQMPLTWLRVSRLLFLSTCCTLTPIPAFPLNFFSLHRPLWRSLRFPQKRNLTRLCLSLRRLPAVLLWKLSFFSHSLFTFKIKKKDPAMRWNKKYAVKLKAFGCSCHECTAQMVHWFTTYCAMHWPSRSAC